MVAERRKLDRKDAFYYITVSDAITNQPRGIMTEISLTGFKLDSQVPIPTGEVDSFRLNLTNEISRKAFIVFYGRSKWCQRDPIDPSIYNVGYEIVNISADDAPIYQRVFEKYGSSTFDYRVNTGNYMWR
jgi:hypothetical protein